MTGAVLCVVGWLAGWLLFGRPSRLPAVAPGGAGPEVSDDMSPSISVVIPARDEELSIGRLLGDLRDCLPPGAQVVVVDDGSEDATAEIAASFPFVDVVDPGEPPDGWTGKPWACRAGAILATGEVLCFVDADVRLAPGALEAVARQVHDRGGLVSVLPRHEPVRPYEELSAVFNVMSVMGVGAGRRDGGTGAFGPLLAVRRRDYETLGGHEAVAGEVVEDLALARHWAAAGQGVASFTGGDLVAFRMYPGGLRALVEGWTKNFATGAAATSPVRMLGAVAWVSGMGSAAGLAVEALGGSAPAAAAAAAWLAWSAQLWVMFRAVGRFRALTAVAFPVPLAAFVAIFARSLWMTAVRRRVTWRGRQVAVTGRARR